MSKPDLIFLTAENKEKIDALAKKERGSRCQGCGYLVIGPHDCQNVDTNSVLSESDQPA